MSKKFMGYWEITEMETWNVEPGWFIELDEQGNGSLHFLYVDVDIDYRLSPDNPNKANFSFYGNDECDETHGQGWIEIEGDHLYGYLCFHQGDESTFTAEKENPLKLKTSSMKKLGKNHHGAIKKSTTKETRKEAKKTVRQIC